MRLIYIYSLKKRKDSKTPQISLLILVTNKDNSKVIKKSSSIKLTWARGFVTNSLHFKHMVMVDCNASNNSQWLLNWFKTQALKTREENLQLFEKCHKQEKVAPSHLF